MAKLTTAKSTMANSAKWLTIGLTAAMLTLAGCSKPEASAPQADQTAQQPAADGSATEANADAKPGDAKEVFRPVSNVTLAPGADPMAIVFATRQANTEPTGSEQIKLSYPAPDKAIVTVTKTGLADDSVAATRTRYEFKPAADASGAKQWQLAQVGEQNKCQRDRGPQDWSAELCK